jgi:hypothetical protein
MTNALPDPVTPATLQACLADWFAPWVQDLGLVVESMADGEVTLRLPFDERLARIGGMVCGQALMAAADTAMVLAIVTQLGTRRPMTTVQLNTSRWPGRMRGSPPGWCGRAKVWCLARSTSWRWATARACAAPAPPTPCSDGAAAGQTRCPCTRLLA